MEPDELPQAERLRVAARARAAAVRGDPARGHRAALPQRILGQSSTGDLRGRRVRRAALQLARQVRLAHGVAELHETARGGQCPRAGGSVALHGTHRNSFGPRLLSSRPRIRRWAGAPRAAVLHELGGAPIHSGRPPRGGGLRPVSPAVPSGGDEGADALTVRDPRRWSVVGRGPTHPTDPIVGPVTVCTSSPRHRSRSPAMTYTKRGSRSPP